jgi:hypothetical protein
MFTDQAPGEHLNFDRFSCLLHLPSTVISTSLHRETTSPQKRMPLATINAVLQLTGAIIGYFKDVQDASQDEINFSIEISALNSLLIALRYRFQDAKPADEWLDATRTLTTQNGPLDQLRSDLERVASKLEPVRGVERAVESIRRQLAWNINKSEINDLLPKIERSKTFVTLALANDLL